MLLVKIERCMFKAINIFLYYTNAHTLTWEFRCVFWLLARLRLVEVWEKQLVRSFTCEKNTIIYNPYTGIYRIITLTISQIFYYHIYIPQMWLSAGIPGI